MPEPDASRRSFLSLLVNTFIAQLTTNFLWSAVTFWLYLETRSILVTAFLGGSFMLLIAAMGVPFGSWVDRTRKKRVMVAAQGVTAALFAAAFAYYLLTPPDALLTVGSPAMMAFLALLLGGVVLESARGIALATCVTILVPPDGRAQANGLVGMVAGLSFATTSVFAGLAVGQLGMTWTLAIAVALTAVSLLHLWTVRIPEPEIVHADGVPKAVDLAGAWRAVRNVPGLVWLLVFTTLNNAVSGVHLALLDPYGLTLVSVEVWGILWGVLSFGFLLGSAWVSRFGLGSRPLRSLLLANVAMWLVGTVFTIRESIWLLAGGIVVYMALIPLVEAAEQTVLQRVVPLPSQGRVFGLAQSVELGAVPLTSFLIGPVAEFWLIPSMATPGGQASWGWLLGEGEARGIALAFVLAGLAGLAFTLAALASRPYRTLSRAYAAAAAADVATWPEPEPGRPVVTD